MPPKRAGGASNEAPPPQKRTRRGGSTDGAEAESGAAALDGAGGAGGGAGAGAGSGAGAGGGGDVDAMIAAAVASALSSERATALASALDKAASVEKQYECAICTSLALEPVVVSCGHLFCHRCLSTWIKGKVAANPLPYSAPCPLCNASLPDASKLTVSAVIAEAIAANNGPAHQERAPSRAMYDALKAGNFDAALAAIEGKKVTQLEDYVDKAKRTTPLLVACEAAEVEGDTASKLALALIAAGADVHVRDSDGHGPLWRARLDTDVLTALLNKGAKEPAALTQLSGVRDGSTGGVHPATEVVISRMIASGDISADAASKEQILCNLCCIGFDAPAVVLINAGVKGITSAGGYTLLHLAAMNGSLATATALLDKGADIDALNDLYQSALHIACQNRHAAVAKLLIARGAKKDGDDAFGRTPSNYAAVAGGMDDVIAALK